MAYVGRQPLAGEVIVLDDIQSQFNGVLTSFTLQRSVGGTTTNFFPVTTGQLLVSLGGTIQEPDRNGNRGFKIDGDQIVFVSPPAAGTDCFIVSYGNVTDIVDYSQFSAFKSTADNDFIYYINPEDLQINTDTSVGNNQSNTFFTLGESLTVTSSGSVTVQDGESLTVEAFSGGSGTGGGNYVLPTASTTTLGGVKVDGTTISISSGTISAVQNIDYSNITNTPDLSLLSRVNDNSRTANDILVWDGSNWVSDGTVTNLILNQARGNFLAGGNTTTVSNYRYNYANGTTSGLKIGGLGTEAGLDIVGENAGDHAASILLRQQNEGYAFVANPSADQLQLKTFTATADDFYVHTTTGGTTIENRLTLDRTTGHILPGADATQDLGSASFRWANIYSADLQLSNEGSANDVDGTWGQYTIQEGENDLFLLNRRNGKTYKFVLQEVN